MFPGHRKTLCPAAATLSYFSQCPQEEQKTQRAACTQAAKHTSAVLALCPPPIWHKQPPPPPRPRLLRPAQAPPLPLWRPSSSPSDRPMHTHREREYIHTPGIVRHANIVDVCRRLYVRHNRPVVSVPDLHRLEVRAQHTPLGALGGARVCGVGQRTAENRRVRSTLKHVV